MFVTCLLLTCLRPYGRTCRQQNAGFTTTLRHGVSFETEALTDNSLLHFLWMERCVAPQRMSYTTRIVEPK